MDRLIFPIYISSATNFTRDKKKFQDYIRKYERSNDGCLQYVTALIRNKDNAILVGFNKKHQSWQIPSGKVDKGEDQKTALKREIKEETNLDIEKLDYIGTSKVILESIVWQGNFYEAKVKGVLETKEMDTMEVFKRVSFIKTDTRLGFGITDGKETITNPQEILQYRHMFTEVLWASTFPNYKTLINGKIPNTNNLDKTKTYIQYRNEEKGSLEIDEYNNFSLSLK